MAKARLAEGEYYHVYNRGVEKRDIFLDDHDKWRFLASLCLLRGDDAVTNMSRMVYDVQHRMSHILTTELAADILKNKTVDLVSFCLMPNHFHLILKERKEGAISKFMQRFGNSYTKYFNARHGRTGHLFGSGFRSVHIDQNAYLNYLSAYIHLNPRELRGWRKKEVFYPWSSFGDCVGKNRWGNFLDPSVIIEQFNDSHEYRLFVEESDIKNEIDAEYLIDCATFDVAQYH